MSHYRTRNQGVCALLRYLYGANAHMATFVEQPRGATFLIDDVEGQCADISRTYHGDDGGPGFAIQNPKAFLDEFIATRKTLSAAIKDGKQWRNEQCQQPE